MGESRVNLEAESKEGHSSSFPSYVSDFGSAVPDAARAITEHPWTCYLF